MKTIFTLLFSIFITTINTEYCEAQWINTGCPSDYAIWDITVKGTNIFAVTNSHFVYRSTNYGLTWVQSNSGLGDQYTQTIVFLGNDIFVGTEFSGVYKSTNNGGSWFQVNNGLSTYCVNSLAVDSTNIYAGTNLGGALYKSINGGLNWTMCSNELIDLIVTKIAVQRNNIFISVAGPGHGIYASTNYGNNWNCVLTSGDGYAVHIKDQYVFAGLGNNVYVSNNNGGSWAEIGLFSGFDIYPKAITTSGNSIYVGAARGGIYKATIGEYNWLEYNDGMPQFGHFVVSFGQNEANLFAGLLNQNGGNGVWRRSLYSVPPNIPQLISPTNSSLNVPLSVSLNWNKPLYALSYRFQLSTDSLFNNLLINDSTITDTVKAVSSLNNITTYWWRVKAKNEVGESGFSSIWKFTTIAPAPAAPVLISPINNSTNLAPNVFLDWGNVINAINYRVQIANDSSFNSIVFDTNYVVPDSLRIRLGVLFVNNKYYWRVNASSAILIGPWSVIWNFRISPTGEINFETRYPNNFKLYSNYPNPFNPTTNIKFNVAKLSDVKIVVYDVTGREVQLLVNESLNPGTYETSFDGSNYSSGVYFYKITAGDFSDTKRMLLTK